MAAAPTRSGVELRNAMAGTTSIMGQTSAAGLLRNLDTSNDDRQEMLGAPSARYETFPLDDGGGDNRSGDQPGDDYTRDQGCDYSFGDADWNRDTADDAMREGAYVPHVAEGIAANAT